MAEQMAVLNIQKTKTSGGLTNHIEREVGMEHSYKGADPAKLEENFFVEEGEDGELKRVQFGEQPVKDVSKAIEERISTGKTSTRKIQHNAVKRMNLLLTGSPEQMQEIFSNEKRADAWIKANYDFLADRFGGAKNIVQFVVHMDEKTPHIHATMVPITTDGRLSADKLFGGPAQFAQHQTAYAKAMEPFGLHRGVEGSKAVHEPAHVWKAKQEAAYRLANTNPIDLTPQKITIKVTPPQLITIDPEKWAKKESAAIEAHVNELVAQIPAPFIQEIERLQAVIRKKNAQAAEAEKKHQTNYGRNIEKKKKELDKLENNLTDLRKEKTKLESENRGLNDRIMEKYKTLTAPPETLIEKVKKQNQNKGPKL